MFTYANLQNKQTTILESILLPHPCILGYSLGVSGLNKFKDYLNNSFTRGLDENVYNELIILLILKLQESKVILSNIFIGDWNKSLKDINLVELLEQAKENLNNMKEIREETKKDINTLSNVICRLLASNLNITEKELNQKFNISEESLLKALKENNVEFNNDISEEKVKSLLDPEQQFLSFLGIDKVNDFYREHLNNNTTNPDNGIQKNNDMTNNVIYARTSQNKIDSLIIIDHKFVDELYFRFHVLDGNSGVEVSKINFKDKLDFILAKSNNLLNEYEFKLIPDLRDIEDLINQMFRLIVSNDEKLLNDSNSNKLISIKHHIEQFLENYSSSRVGMLSNKLIEKDKEIENLKKEIQEFSDINAGLVIENNDFRNKLSECQNQIKTIEADRFNKSQLLMTNEDYIKLLEKDKNISNDFITNLLVKLRDHFHEDISNLAFSGCLHFINKKVSLLIEESNKTKVEEHIESKPLVDLNQFKYGATSYVQNILQENLCLINRLELLGLEYNKINHENKELSTITKLGTGINKRLKEENEELKRANSILKTTNEKLTNDVNQIHKDNGRMNSLVNQYEKDLQHINLLKNQYYQCAVKIEERYKELISKFNDLTDSSNHDTQLLKSQLTIMTHHSNNMDSANKSLIIKNNEMKEIINKLINNIPVSTTVILSVLK